MPSLYDLRLDFSKATSDQKIQFIRAYRKRRETDLAKPATYGAKASVSTSIKTQLQNIGLSPEEIAICKALGLKPKDILALKERTLN